LECCFEGGSARGVRQRAARRSLFAVITNQLDLLPVPLSQPHSLCPGRARRDWPARVPRAPWPATRRATRRSPFRAPPRLVCSSPWVVSTVSLRCALHAPPAFAPQPTPRTRTPTRGPPPAIFKPMHLVVGPLAMAPHPCLLPRMSTPPGCLSIASLHSMKGPERATTPLSCAQSLRVSISHTHPRHRHVRVHVDLPRSARRPPVPGCSWVNPPIDQDEAVRSPYAALRCA
jgi:hypothetical protein